MAAATPEADRTAEQADAAEPQNPIEVFSGSLERSRSEYLVPIVKNQQSSDSEKPELDKKSAQDLADQQKERDQAAIKAEADKLTAIPRSIVFRAEGRNDHAVPVPTLGAATGTTSRLIARFSLPLKAEAQRFAGIGDARDHFASVPAALAPASAPEKVIRPLKTVAVAVAVAAAPAPATARPTQLDQAAGARSFRDDVASQPSRIEVAAFSTVKPFAAIGANVQKPHTLGAVDTAARARPEPLARAASLAPASAASHADPFATP